MLVLVLVTGVCVSLARAEGEADPGGNGGSGQQYLHMTENRWDGKTAWFTGSNCECNGWATRCQFNEDLYRQTGNGVQCLQCGGNRAGAKCEKCSDGFYPDSRRDKLGRQSCIPCNCNEAGSNNDQCSDSGECECREGVVGTKCDRCLEQSWSFPTCRPCPCLPAGSVNSDAQCMSDQNGSCECKKYVEGDNCDQCIAGYFQISAENPFGCSPCFCNGHSAKCKMALGYVKTSIKSQFSRGLDEWTAEESGVRIQDRTIFNAYKKMVGIQSLEAPAYFVAPRKFLGNQIASYGQKLKFKLKIGNNDGRFESSTEDIILEGGDKSQALSVGLHITAQNNPTPNGKLQQYVINLHPDLGWKPQLSPQQFMTILNNITSIKIRGTYQDPGEGYLDSVELETALRGSGGEAAQWVEECECPVGYKGQHCETCERGYYRETGGRCVPCSCHGHSDYCHVDTGVCDCTHNTVGDTCDTCADGYYGDARAATPDDCQPCPCPQVSMDDGSTRLGRCYMSGSTAVCTECPAGRTGARCEQCVDGYYGDPEGLHGPARPCVMCQCNGNIDLNSSGNCDQVTGQCLRCINNTAGDRCEVCSAGHWGSAVDRSVGCEPCQCYQPGSITDHETGAAVCDRDTGQCQCKDNIAGHLCDTCRPSYWNIDSGAGCDPCNCDPIGSLSQSCDIRNGRCQCRPGITGHRCDVCMSNHFGFSPDGCRTCDCNGRGSKSVSCNQLTGQCSCVSDKVTGRRCDICVENTQSRGGDLGQCQPCEECYNLVQEAVDNHRDNLRQLDDLLQQIAENPQPVGEDFEEHLGQLEMKIKILLANSKQLSEDTIGVDLREQLENLMDRLRDTHKLVGESEKEILVGIKYNEEAAHKATVAGRSVHRVRDSMMEVKLKLIGDCKRALEKAQERSRKFGEGSERMSDIAGKARRLSEKQELDAAEIETMAGEANKLANQANKLAVEGLAEQVKTSGQIHKILSVVEDLSGKLETIENLSFEALGNAQSVYSEALSIYRKIYNLESPKVETKYLTEKSLSLLREAERVRTDASNLLNNNEDLLQQTQANREELMLLLNRALGQQKEVEDRLNDMIEHKIKGKEAVALGDDILTQARDTLEILKDFENRVANNREAARAALKKSNEIEETIREALDKTLKASEFLRDTDKDSSMANTLASESSLLAEKASSKARMVSQESTGTRQEAANLLRIGRIDEKKVNSFFTIAEQKEKIAAKDSKTASESLREANKAQSNADRAALKVREAKEELDAILDIIATVEEPEPGILDDLERRLDDAERKYQEAGIEVRLEQLFAERQRQNEVLMEYREEMEVLISEYQSLEEISSSLPDQCWNKIRLEP